MVKGNNKDTSTMSGICWDDIQCDTDPSNKNIPHLETHTVITQFMLLLHNYFCFPSIPCALPLEKLTP